MILNKKQIDLLKVLEVRLYYTHKAIRKFNKDIHCDNGQEYPVPVVKNEDSLEKQLEFSFTNGHLEEGDHDIQWQKDNKSK